MFGGKDEKAENQSKISKEVAENDFRLFCEENEFDADDLDENKQALWEMNEKTIVKAIMQGRCIVEGGSLTYTVSKFAHESIQGQTVKIERPSGGRFMTSLDGVKDSELNRKYMQAISCMLGKDMKWVAKLDMKDFAVLTCVVTLFLNF